MSNGSFKDRSEHAESEPKQKQTPLQNAEYTLWACVFEAASPRAFADLEYRNTLLEG